LLGDKGLADLPNLERSEYWEKVIAEIPDEEIPPWVSMNDIPYVRYWMKRFVKYEVDKEHKIGYIVWNRPAKLNAGLPYAASEACLVARDDPNIKVIVMKGAGRAFGAGYDITPRPPRPGEPNGYYSKRTKTGVEEWTLTHREERMNEFYRHRMWDNPKPIIVSAHGFVTAGALHVTAHCDMVVASDDALFGYPILRAGGALGIKAVWPHYIGLRKAKEMLMTGCYISAQEAYIRGWVNTIVPREKLEEETFILAKGVASLPAPQLATVKRALNNYYDGQLGLRSFLDWGEVCEAIEGHYLGSEKEYGTPTWIDKQRERGLSYYLRERGKPFEGMDRWWREKYAARPKFEKGRLEKDWKKIAEEQKKRAEEYYKKKKDK
jgi:enoyl-CoA hydratase